MDTKLKDQPDSQYYDGSMEACVKVREQGEVHATVMGPVHYGQDP